MKIPQISFVGCLEGKKGNVQEVDHIQSDKGNVGCCNGKLYSEEEFARPYLVKQVSHNKQGANETHCSSQVKRNKRTSPTIKSSFTVPQPQKNI